MEPQPYYEASLRPEWFRAINQEMEAFYRDNTWIITYLHKQKKSHWLSLDL